MNTTSGTDSAEGFLYNPNVKSIRTKFTCGRYDPEGPAITREMKFPSVSDPPTISHIGTDGNNV